MTIPLFESIPGFDQPIAVLKHCHDRIRKQIQTLHKLAAHLPDHGADEQAQHAAQAVIQYFSKAAHLHHADEEQDLMPMLQAAASGEDAVLLAGLLPEILLEHQRMDVAWKILQSQLQKIAAGTSRTLSPQDMENFSDLYAAHLVKEETYIAPMAKRLFSAEQMARLGQAMQLRRGIAPEKNAKVVQDMRKDYRHASLSETDVLANPVAQFSTWFDEALAADLPEPNAMSVATVGEDGRPSSRILLIKQFDSRGFTWFTNYESRKGHELQHNQYAAMLFFWRELERQVRIEGRVERIAEDENDAYFNSRPLASRLGAIASLQSQPIENREALEARLAEVAAECGEHPARPAQWGGYRLVPDRIEFWQGRSSRLHDRILFSLQADGSWLRQRLQP